MSKKNEDHVSVKVITSAIQNVAGVAKVEVTNSRGEKATGISLNDNKDQAVKEATEKLQDKK